MGDTQVSGGYRPSSLPMGLGIQENPRRDAFEHHAVEVLATDLGLHGLEHSAEQVAERTIGGGVARFAVPLTALAIGVHGLAALVPEMVGVHRVDQNVIALNQQLNNAGRSPQDGAKAMGIAAVLGSLRGSDVNQLRQNLPRELRSSFDAGYQMARSSRELTGFREAEQNYRTQIRDSADGTDAAIRGDTSRLSDASPAYRQGFESTQRYLLGHTDQIREIRAQRDAHSREGFLAAASGHTDDYRMRTDGAYREGVRQFSENPGRLADAQGIKPFGPIRG